MILDKMIRMANLTKTCLQAETIKSGDSQPDRQSDFIQPTPIDPPTRQDFALKQEVLAESRPAFRPYQEPQAIPTPAEQYHETLEDLRQAVQALPPDKRALYAENVARRRAAGEPDPGIGWRAIVDVRMLEWT